MSHFSVTVATAADDADEAAEYISALLDPFNENLEVEQHTEDGETWWRNPNAKWDWWMVGGRWSGDLRLRRGARRGDYLRGERSWTNENEPIDWGTCDGGRIRALDLAAMRTSAATKAVEDWNEYAVVVDGTPQHLPWQVFTDRVDAQADQNRHHEFLDRAVKELEAADAAWQASGYTLDKARADYVAQPRIAALRAHPAYQNFLFTWPEDIFEHRDRDECAQFAGAKAVPGYALLTDDGRWIEPGRMGWWGRSTETDASMDTYLAEANAYIDGLSPQMWLANVDCHI